jgi:CAAX prenyl protease-like protein
MNLRRNAMAAHVGPFLLFLLALALVQAVQHFLGRSDLVLLARPEYAVYPLQTLVCAAALLFWWRNYEFGSQRSLPLAFGAGVVVFAIWVSPQALFHQPARLEGFDPTAFADQPALYWGTVVARFLRLVVVVPLVEEIFWRGFLQRYLVNERFTSVPFGTYTPLSFWGVAVGFTLIHMPADRPAAFVTGAIYGLLAVRTRSLLACVAAHATTNLLLGLYIMATRQWGFW